MSQRAGVISEFLATLLLFAFASAGAQTYFDGGALQKNHTFQLSGSPYVIRNDLLVLRGVTLTVEAGVELRFEPRTRLLVEGGTLIARGTESQRIRMVRNRAAPGDIALRFHSMTLWDSSSETATVADGTLRLVDGDGGEAREGMLQLRLAGRWRSVCSNGRLWQAESARVACTQLGFADGNFTFAQFAPNNTYYQRAFYLRLAEPNCSGSEANLIECDTMQRALGMLRTSSGPYPTGFGLGYDVCDSQLLVGLRCWSVANNSAFSNNWHGLVMANSSWRELVFSEREGVFGAAAGSVRMNVSASVLEYVDISGAGVNASGHSVAALSASPLVPPLLGVRVFGNAYDGGNFTEIKSPLFVTDSQFERNNGIGMNVSTAVGYVRLDRVRATLNAGDGVRIKVLNRNWLESELADRQQLLCQSVSGSTVYPLYVRAAGSDPRQNVIVMGGGGSYQQRLECGLYFSTASQQVFTVSISHVKLDANASAVIRIYDHIQVNQPMLISEWFFDSVRYYQSVTSRSSYIRISMTWYKPNSPPFCVTLRECVDIVMLVHVGPAVHRQITVTDSYFAANAQRGLMLVDTSGFLFVNQSRFVDNQFDAGFKLLNGSADLLLNASLFERNDDSGVNVSYSGGYKVLNSTVFRANRGYGAVIQTVDDWRLRTRENSVQRTDVYLSTFTNNEMAGLRVTNSCYSHAVLVNISRFERNLREAIQLVSCERERVGRRTDNFAREYVQAFETFTTSGTNLVPGVWCGKLGAMYDNVACSPPVTRGLQQAEMTNLTVAFATFLANQRESLLITPATNLNGTVRNCTFTANLFGVINMDNSDDPARDRLYAKLPVYYSVENNRFEQNVGEFVVNARLTHISTYQSLTVLYNIMFNNSAWRPTFTTDSSTSRLSTRNRIRAIVVISSSNVKVQRNWLENGPSIELGTQLRDASASIDASLNYWGVPQQLSGNSWDSFYRNIVLNRLFDGGNRYNLAGVRFWPVLKTNDLLSTYSTIETPTYKVEFIRGSSIGGSLDSSLGTVQTLPRGNYIVDRDIVVPYNFRWVVEAGTQLSFANSVGMLVQGQVVMDAPFEPQRLQLTVAPTTSMRLQFPSVFGLPEPGFNVSLLQSLPVQILRINTPSSSYAVEGWAQVKMAVPGSNTPVWGTVCNRGWSLREAVVFCGQLGLIARVAQLPPSAAAGSESSTPIHLSSVRCSDWARSIFECEADRAGQHSCTHADDVLVQCYAPGWAGMRFAVSAQPGSTLQNVKIVHGGMFDAQSAQYVAGVQIDFNRHALNKVIVSDNRADGLSITHADALGKLSLTDSTLENNLNTGLLLRSPYLTVNRCTMKNNAQAGLRYDPSLAEQDAYSVQSVITNVVDLVQSETTGVSIQQDGFTYLRIPRNAQNQSKEIRVELSASTNYRIVLELIDFNPRTTEEQVYIYDSRKSESSPAFWWRVPEDLVAFPIVSTSSFLTVWIKTQGIRSGRFLFVAQSRSFVGDPNLSISMARATGRFLPARFTLINSQLAENGVGASLTHYNDPADLVLERETLFFRRKNEEFLFNNDVFDSNRADAVYSRSLSRFASLDATQYVPPSNFSFLMFESSAKFSFVNYSFVDSTFTFNGRIVHFDHDQVEYANVVYNWTFSNSNFVGNNPSAVLWLEMPFLTRRADRAESNRNHLISMTRNSFSENVGLKVSIRGYYADVNIVNNQFEKNDCSGLGGILQLYGMEKKYSITSNKFLTNSKCLFAIEARINSQSENSKAISCSIERNQVTENTCFATFRTTTDVELMDTLSNLTQPSCYAIGIFGVQAPSVTRNVLQNDAYPVELVGGLLNSIDLKTTLNASMNYWGTTVPKASSGTSEISIADRVFDFDDWNSFSFVDYSNFLMKPEVTAPSSAFIDQDWTTLSGGDAYGIEDARVLGGHIAHTITLRARSDGYVVRSDLTVMPNAVLSIDAGTRFEFFPNVGILILGRLIVRGSSFNPVRFGPVQPDTVRALLNDGTIKIPGTRILGRRRRNSVLRRAKRQFGAPSWIPPSVSGDDVQPSLERGRVTLFTNWTRLIGGNRLDEGYLEFWNETSQHWSLACDMQFSEEAARVACRELRNVTDQTPMNVEFRFSSLYDSQVFGYDNAYVSKDFWRTSYACTGTEQDLAACTSRFNYAWQMCAARKDYVFLRCAEQNLVTPLKYWGSVRFGNTALEYAKRVVYESYTNYLEPPYDSVVNYLQITGAGYLHNERTSAMLSVLETPNVRYTTVRNCSLNAITYIAPLNGITFFNNTVRDNLGYGLGVLMLNGDTRISLTEAPAFIPLTDNTIPHGSFGLLSMCDTQKRIVVRDRLIVYFQYSFSQQQRTILCTKLFKSEVAGRPIVLRFLQLALVYEPFQKNAIELFSGEQFNSTQMLAVIVPPSPSDTQQTGSNVYDPYSAVIMDSGSVNSALQNMIIPQSVAGRRAFKTDMLDSLGVNVYASAGRSTYGFIAEIVTVSGDNSVSSSAYPKPPSEIGVQHQVRQSLFHRNQNGAIRYQQVGRANPPFEIYFNQFTENGVRILNLSSASAVSIEMQNSPRLTVLNNFIGRNFGGLRITAWNDQVMDANVSNNAITGNSNDDALSVSSNGWCNMRISQNWIVNNLLEMRNVIRINNVAANFSRNTIFRNVGGSIINVSIDQRVSFKDYFISNGLYENYATNYSRHSTIYAAGSGHVFTNNYLLNELNDFELQTANMSIVKSYSMTTGAYACGTDIQTCPAEKWLLRDSSRCICYLDDPIVAKNNWWGWNSSSFVRARIHDRYDDDYLVPVNYDNFYSSNSSVIDGYCPPTWTAFQQRCFRFIGGPLPYMEAKLQCETDGALIADTRAGVDFLTELIRRSQVDYESVNRFAIVSRAWVFSARFIAQDCPVVRNYFLETFACEAPLPFICERLPYVTEAQVDPLAILASSTVIACCLLLIAIFSALFICKSHRRKQESRLRRRAFTINIVTAKKSETQLTGFDVTQSVAPSQVGSSRMQPTSGSYLPLGSGERAATMSDVSFVSGAPSTSVTKWSEQPKHVAARTYIQKHAHTMSDEDDDSSVIVKSPAGSVSGFSQPPSKILKPPAKPPPSITPIVEVSQPTHAAVKQEEAFEVTRPTAGVRSAARNQPQMNRPDEQAVIDAPPAYYVAAPYQDDDVTQRLRGEAAQRLGFGGLADFEETISASSSSHSHAPSAGQRSNDGKPPRPPKKLPPKPGQKPSKSHSREQLDMQLLK